MTFWAIWSFVNHIGNCRIVGAYIAYMLEFAVWVRTHGRYILIPLETDQLVPCSLCCWWGMGDGQTVVTCFLRKICSCSSNETSSREIPHCGRVVLVCPAKARFHSVGLLKPSSCQLRCSYLLKALVITHRAVALVFQIGINGKSLISHEVLYVLWLLLAPHSSVNCEVLQLLSMLVTDGFLVHALDSSSLQYVPRHSGSKSAISINPPDSILQGRSVLLWYQ